MDANALTDRTRSQEERYFSRLEADRKRTAEAIRSRAELARECGVDDDVAVDAMIAAGLTNASLPAIEWTPLVFVAWADGAVQPEERDALLRIAEGDGIPAGHPAHALLREWLTKRPSDDLLDAWRRYLEATARSESKDLGRIRAEWLRTRTREVAEASGGWLGFGKISREEGAALLEVARVMHRSGIA